MLTDRQITQMSARMAASIEAALTALEAALELADGGLDLGLALEEAKLAVRELQRAADIEGRLA